ATLVNIPIVVAVLWDVAPHGALTGWALALIAVTASRIGLWRRFRADGPKHRDAEYWARWFTIGAGAGGVAWGAAGVGLFLIDPFSYQAFVALVLGGMAAGVAVAYAPHLPAVVVFAFPAILPVAANFLSRSDGISLALGGMTLIYLVSVFAVARNLNATLISSLRLQAENKTLLRSLRHSLEEVEASEARFRDFAESSSDWLWETDAELRYTSVDPKSAGVAGEDAEFMAGKMAEPEAGNDPDAWRRHRADLAARRPFRNFTFRRSGTDGPSRVIRVSGKPIFGTGGDFLGYRGVGTDITDQVETEAQARTAQERLASAIDRLSETVALFDPDRRLIICNLAWREVNREVADQIRPGMRLEDHLRVGLEHGHYPDARGREEAWLRERLERHDNPAGPFEQQRQDGTWLLVDEQRLPDGSIVVVGSDISEMKRREAALRESEERFRDFTESASDWYWETDPDHRFTRVGVRMLASIGYDPEDAVGKTRDQMPGIVVEDSDAWRDYRADLEARRSFRNFVYRRVERGGRTRHVRISGKPAFGPDGEFLGYRGVGTDITAQIEIEARARTAQERLGAALEGISESLRLYDADDRLVIANSAWLKFNRAVADRMDPGGRFEDHMRATLSAGLVPESEGREEEWLRERMERHRNPTEPFELQRQDGRWLIINEERLADGSTLVVGSDITERRRAEKALRAAKESAEVANRAKSEFLAAMSHELRTPLNAVISYAELIERDDSGHGAHADYAQAIRESGTHLLDIINDILDVSKIESGRLELQEDLVDLADLIVACHRLIKERAAEAGVAVTISVEDDLPILEADARRVKQIVINLLSNAIKFTPPGGDVVVRAAPGADGGVALEIVDTGVGMRQEDVGLALTPFVQVQSGRDRGYEGTGLGLPLTKNLIELHGGTLELESAPGAGTRALVSFPQSRVAA
ncbi:MAG: PAS-domain containing protein, partial [Alphaproteobacteria bacterium]|nr:PAS-domain containing protein [Alphaproteobacteria bacterium]